MLVNFVVNPITVQLFICATPSLRHKTSTFDTRTIKFGGFKLERGSYYTRIEIAHSRKLLQTSMGKYRQPECMVQSIKWKVSDRFECSSSSDKCSKCVRMVTPTVLETGRYCILKRSAFKKIYNHIRVHVQYATRRKIKCKQMHIMRMRILHTRLFRFDVIRVVASVAVSGSNELQ